jgi:hypothetical protein
MYFYFPWNIFPSKAYPFMGQPENTVGGRKGLFLLRTKRALICFDLQSGCLRVIARSRKPGLTCGKWFSKFFLLNIAYQMIKASWSDYVVQVREDTEIPFFLSLVGLQERGSEIRRWSGKRIVVILLHAGGKKWGIRWVEYTLHIEGISSSFLCRDLEGNAL